MDEVAMASRQRGRAPWSWGPAGEPLVRLPEELHCDVRRADRAVATDAGAEDLYLWLCQLRRAPYSYDWIDNAGRRSPRTPDPSLITVAVGDRAMTIFDVTAVEEGRSLTLRMRPGLPRRIFGDITVHYGIESAPSGRGRLLVGRLWVPRPAGTLGALRREALLWGDLLMMRRQLLTLARLAAGSGAA